MLKVNVAPVLNRARRHGWSVLCYVPVGILLCRTCFDGRVVQIMVLWSGTVEVV